MLLRAILAKFKIAGNADGDYGDHGADERAAVCD